jgi:gliding motility-associated-like protein
MNSVTYTVAATGTALKYQWQVSTDMGVTYANIFNVGAYTGAYTNTLNVSTVALRMNGFTYRCIVSGTCNPATSSNAALLTITTPIASFTINNVEQCLSGNSFQFTNTSNTNVGTLYYVWDFGDGVGTSTVINPVYKYKTPGTYFVKLISLTNSGVKDSAYKTVTVYPQPNPSFKINTKEQCLLNNSFEFANTTNVTGAPIFGFDWKFGNGTGSSNINPIKSYPSAGTYTVQLKATTFYGCADSVTQQVIVDTMPVVTINTPAGTDICAGGTLNLTSTGGLNYQWYNNAVLIPSQNASTLVANTGGTYNVVAMNSMGCYSQNQVKAVINTLTKPKADFTYGTYCIQVPIAFTNKSTISTSGVVNYVWSDGQGNTSTSIAPTFTFAYAGNANVKLKVIPLSCPLLVDSITQVLAIEGPTTAVRMPLIDIARGEEVILHARTFGSSYLWTPSTGLNDVTLMSPSTILSTEQTYKIQITSRSGCQTVDTLQVRVFDNYEVFVPNAFTPNGDGVNDQLKMNLIGIKEIKYFRVYNRVGQKVFETVNPDQGWDGMVNGVLQPFDTYMWIVEGINKFGTPVRGRGTTTLIR